MKHLKTALLGAACAAAFASPALAELKPGDTAPAFTAPAYLAGEAFTFKLADALAKGPVVVYFFPAANTPGCNVEAALFSQVIEKFRTHGASVIGVTAGNVDQLAEFSSNTETCAGKFPVAADTGAKIAAEYDAVLDKKPEWADRTSYTVAPDGTIAAVYSDANPNRHVREMLAAVEALEK
ncbi:hypothetical protein N799_01150 [Lysobacter arseniciresistens ZS79]|uniref:thioredoxin-dependent peroxiredoxin n=1 Tax=Lysobacter arseniciresistens ZS79 TaxID=913325 RepID=A0A0A0F5N6_9GAMM|nr:redoxin domain-containing protein [Lysobacter arseniciresistens]KGM57800.1 hypothetical protein N799_01150 [Lysobacter arseniciresistens ZS79]